MINLIKADLYRIFKSSGIYITLGIAAFFEIMTMSTFTYFTSCIKKDPVISNCAFNFILYVLYTPVLVIPACYVTYISCSSCRTDYNILLIGNNKKNYYISRVILIFIIMNFMCLCLNTISSIIILKSYPALIFQFNIQETAEFIILNTAHIAAIAAICMFFTSIFRKSVFLKTLGASSCLLILIMEFFLMYISDKFSIDSLTYFLSNYSINVLLTNALDNNISMPRALIIFFIYIFLFGASGVYIFKKKDL